MRMSIRVFAVLVTAFWCVQPVLGQTEPEGIPVQNMTFAETAAICGGSEAAAPEAPAGTSRSNCCCNCDPLWIVDADAVFLQRSAPRSQQVTLSGGNNDQLKCPVAAGFDIDLVRQHVAGTDWGLEGAYLGVDSFHSQETVEFPYHGYFSGDYQSALRSVELNARRDWNDWLTILAGVRFINLAENVAESSLVVAPPPELWVMAGRNDNSTNNQMVGFQLGADTRVLQRDRFNINFISKAGIYGNRATNANWTVNPGAPGGFSYYSALANPAAFEGELKLAATYSITDALSFSVGYQLMWLSGVALATDQPLGTARVDSSGTVFYNGAFVGLEYCR